MSELFGLIAGAALFNNLVLIHLLGVPELMLCSRRTDVSLVVGFAFLLTLSLAVPLGALVYRLCILPLQLEYLSLVFYALISLLSVQLLQWLCQRHYPQHTDILSACTPLLLMNPVLVGALNIHLGQNNGLAAAICSGLGAGLGTGLAFVLFCFLQQRLQMEQVPALFRGLPILLLSLGLIAMAFSGIAA